MAISTKELRDSLGNLGNTVKNSVADVLQSTDFISRTIGMNNSYEDLMYVVQALGREPVSLLGKDFAFIYDHVRRNYEQGTTISGIRYGVDTSGTGDRYSCAKFTFYKERPTIRFADPYTDPMNLLDRWMPDFKLKNTKAYSNGYYYAESHDDKTNNINISDFEANAGTESGVIVNSIKSDEACDLVRKTNDYFKHGKYRTLVARFHTDSEDSKDFTNSTQTAISRQYGMSHGRNLLSGADPVINGYDNPYCRVWTYHHQYKSMMETIRPFQGDVNTAEELETKMLTNGYDTVGFRTKKTDNFDGGSGRLDKHGVLNYENGLVNIAPKAKIKNYFDGKEDDKDEKTVSIKRCMFSIENLAWKGGNKNRGANEFDPLGLSAEQKGPLGGRIMWFPPYDLKFNETSTAKWNSNEFIGRGENIYTYVNTERRGSLSFKLLIDHPAIVDYWAEKNNDSSYWGVDDTTSNEAKLLRFFAGCDILKAKPQKYWYKDPIVKPKEEKKEELEQPKNSEPPKEKAKPEPKFLYCFVYFPNNYSGKDDGGVVKPMHYLANGVGTQKQINVNGGDEPSDFSVDINSTGFPGYEMRANSGVSYATEVLEKQYEKVERTFYKKNDKATKQEYLTNSGGTEIVVNGHTLAKQVYSGALNLAQAENALNLSGTTRAWFRQRWYYRVDKDTELQKLHLKDGEQKNYLDTTSNQYNSTGYNSISQELKDAVGFVEDDKHSLVSFADMFIALENVTNKAVYSELYNDENVKLIKEIKEGKKYKFINARFYGGASSQQNNASSALNKRRNNTLADNRMRTFKKWLSSVSFPCTEEGDGTQGNMIFQQGGEKFDVNNSITKQWRCACVEIKYEEVEEEPAQVVETTIEKNKDVTVDGRSVDSPKVESVTIPTPKTENHYFEGFNASQGGRMTSIWQPEAPTLSKPDASLAEKYMSSNTMGIAISGDTQQTPYTQVKANEIINFASTNYTSLKTAGLTPTALAAAGHTAPPQPKEDKTEDNNGIVGYNTKEGTVERYDNEGEFFKSLDKKAPFLHRLISEKIKYFDPAFHSISPEGFNARLTFLHQCTRQGATIGNSDSNMLTAYNLAFGRPPVCVLRIGDFYYTKIIINSVDIDYDDMQWDLNPEGIGVMPMMANVKINFVFIGGSDLAGPISRLQNAVSFNYYANTGVYDNRAEMVEYSGDKSGKEVKYKPFVYPTIESTSKGNGGGDVATQEEQNL